MTDIKLSAQEMARYARHIAIPEFNVEGQKKLKAAKVLVIGSGGLGSPVLLYLAAAGVGHLGIVDFDVVDDSNLQRQVLFTVDDVGKSKAETAKKRLHALNPHIKITVHNTRLTKENALDLINQYDIVADGTDNFPTRYLVNDACVLSGKTNVYASIFRFEGQVSVFNYLNEDGTRGPNYRDMFPEPPPPGLVPNCAEGGVLGVLPGIIGSLQACEVIKVITGIGEPLAGRIFLFDAASFTTRTLKVNKNPKTKITELINYEQFCGILPTNVSEVKEITVKELYHLQVQSTDFQLIDVREPYEYEIANLEGELIPLGAIAESAERISRDKKVIIHCRSGKRSADAIRELESLHGFDNLYNLKGGILAWSKEIDSEIPTY
ncbi:MAG: molybdopterin-synthase adenylyltransferase MoeB [Bacteroidetes bacterium]|jgi:molybdopterin/thiamine biosynthesis adenylyltransferase/rhodanese-related sulfurtransferase|nr:molybdopterin-synthase adenylyltransferase MoeB [Bacteroidota bacterium]MDF1866447.1 molybdopterin-synthase adenylyltransferase MoeB [Saprospiraceae bacterium]